MEDSSDSREVSTLDINEMMSLGLSRMEPTAAYFDSTDSAQQLDSGKYRLSIYFNWVLIKYQIILT